MRIKEVFLSKETILERPVNNLVFERLLTRLAGNTLSFPHPAEDLKVLQTHISIVLLAGDFAYKIKKPVNFPFVDYSTLNKRRDFCQLEVDLNRRLSENLYLGVVPITRLGGQLSMEGRGVVVEYAVKMRRLPDDNRLNCLLEKGSLPGDFWGNLATRLVHFYREAARGPEIAQWGDFISIQEDWEQILAQLTLFPPEILEPSFLEKLGTLARENLTRNKTLISKRTPKTRDGHGDLRLEHIYYFPGESKPGKLAIIDCLEFNPRYRCGDPLLDIAFLAMDLENSGFRRESRIFTGEFMKKTADSEGIQLMDFYTAYRHLVRGLVRGLQAREEDVSEQEKETAANKSRVHFKQALIKLEKPGLRPCLILLGGLPGAGKSTLSHQLVQRENFQVFSSDSVRKELAGQPLDSKPGTGFEKGIYKPEWTEKTYQALWSRAESALQRDQRVLVDASFWNQASREHFLNLARGLNLPFLFFVCMISHETAEKRLSENRHFASDADLGVFKRMAARWEPPSPELGTLFLNTERPIEVNLSEIHRVLGEQGLAADTEQ